MPIVSPEFRPMGLGRPTMAETQTEKEYENNRKLSLIAAQNAGQAAVTAMREAWQTERENADNATRTNLAGMESAIRNKQLNQAAEQQQRAYDQLGLENRRNAELDARNAEKANLENQATKLGLEQAKAQQAHNAQVEGIKDLSFHFNNSVPDADGNKDMTAVKKQLGTFSGIDTSGYQSIIARPASVPGYFQFYGDKDGKSFEPLETPSGKPVALNTEFIKQVSLMDGKTDKNTLEKIKVSINDRDGNPTGETREILFDRAANKVIDPEAQLQSQTELAKLQANPIKPHAQAPAKTEDYGVVLNNVGSTGFGFGGKATTDASVVDTVPEGLSISQQEWERLSQRVKDAHRNELRRKELMSSAKATALGIGQGLANMRGAGKILHQ